MITIVRNNTLIHKSIDKKTLVAKQLQCIRDDRLLFDQLDFTLSEGQLLQIEGRNGSGKTSLLRILCGLTLPTQGGVFWNGNNIHTINSNYWATLTYVGHAAGVKADLTPLENLAIARALGQQATEIELDEALKQVGLYGFEDIPTRTLSAGQQRRVALARLLINRSQLWILDEPFTALDRTAITLVEHLLEAHIACGGMTILTSHHPVNCRQAHYLRLDS